MCVEVEGELKSVLASYRLHLQMERERGKVSEDDMMKEFTRQFIIEDNKQVAREIEELKNSIQEKKAELEKRRLEKQNTELESQNPSEGEVVNELEEENSESEIQSTAESPSGFLAMVQNVSNAVEEDTVDDVDELFEGMDEPEEGKVEEVEEFSGEVVHGVFIDEWFLEDSGYVEEQEEVEEYNESESEEFVPVEETEEEFFGEVVHGVYIDEWVKPEVVEEPIEDVLEEPVEEVVNTTENTSEDDDFLQNLVPDEELSEDEFFASAMESKADTKQQGTSPPKPEKPAEQQEVVVVPTNIRDFVKSNQGVAKSYVLQYYDAKTIKKAISLGKIYEKKGKLYT